MLEFSRQKAIILGSFSGSTPMIMMQGYNPGVSVRVLWFPPVDSTLLLAFDFGHEQRTVTAVKHMPF